MLTSARLAYAGCHHRRCRPAGQAAGGLLPVLVERHLPPLVGRQCRPAPTAAAPVSWCVLLPTGCSDGAHAKHNQATGDNVGPLLVKKE